MKNRSRKTKNRAEQGMELLELALVLPLLLVIAAGVMDFGNAWRVRQVLANAAREGARLGSTQPMLDLNNTTAPKTVQEICQDVANYLARANVSTTFMNGTSSNPAAGCASPTLISATNSTVANPVPLGWTYYSSGTYGLKIERTLLVSTSTSVSGVSSTRVTLNFPFYWPFGFNHLARNGTSNGEPTPIPIQVNAVMANTD